MSLRQHRDNKSRDPYYGLEGMRDVDLHTPRDPHECVNWYDLSLEFRALCATYEPEWDWVPMMMGGGELILGRD